MNIMEAFGLLYSAEADKITCEPLKELHQYITVGCVEHGSEFEVVELHDGKIRYADIWIPEYEEIFSDTWEVVE